MKPIRNGTIHKTGLAQMTLCAFFVLGMANVAQAVDTDGDGMPDEYEAFYGLSVTNPADAAEDPDGEGLTNLAESVKMTDPYVSDTDRDGWNDRIDSNAISRAYIQWGNLRFTDGDQYDYAAPAWLLGAGAYKVDGEWATNPVSWHVPAMESNDVGSLNVDLDREILTNNLVYRLRFFAHTNNASLFIDLLDKNSEMVAENLYGNLNAGSNVEATIYLAVPLANNEAAVIHLRRGTGEATVYDSLLYISEDGDGLDREQEAQLGTSDYNADSDGDGLSDWDEVFIYGTNPAQADTDGDGMKDGWEVLHGLNPKVNDAGGDQDGDGVSNLTEYLQGRDPCAGAVADTTGVVNLKVYTVLE